ncbi:MAG: adenylosuccinate synthase [Phycisphaerales bacterium]|nr:adenylosuccinate synthase [Phycisphaerales bacterium]
MSRLALQVVDLCFGDSGKGTMVDYLVRRHAATLVVRFNGGPQAGHNVVLPDGRHHTFAQFGAGTFSPGVRTLLSRFTLIEPYALFNEADHLSSLGVHDALTRLFIDERCLVITPPQQIANRLRERGRGAAAHGTCGLGVGECVADAVTRPDLALRAGDLRTPAIVRRKLADMLAYKRAGLSDLRSVATTEEQRVLDDAAWIDVAMEACSELVERTNILTPKAANALLRDSSTSVFEGAQGVLLDIDHGTFPYVTSSNCVAGAVATGVGVAPQKVDRVLGIAKAYTTRVGSGPFPTELIGAIGDRLQTEGKEFGATTGRPRRCGWLDLLVLKHSVRVSGLTSLALTKLDVLSTFESIPICTGYRWRGEVLTEFPENLEVLEGAQPIYEEMHGWTSSLDGVSRFEDLPDAARAYVETIEKALGVPVDMISIGPDRKETIIRRHPLS